MLNQLKITVETALNKNQMGKPSPLEFNHAVGKALEDVFSKLFSDYRKLNYRKSRFQDTPGYGSEAEYLKQCIEYYVSEIQDMEETSPNVYDIPDDLYFIDSLFSNSSVFEKVELNTFNILTRLHRTKPTNCSPVFTFNGRYLKVFPKHDELQLHYIRKPKSPKWTYRIINGQEVYSPDLSDFQELDIHPLMYTPIFIETLALLGLNMREEHAAQYVNVEKQESVMNRN